MILDRGDTESGFSGPFPGQHLLSLHSKEHSSFEDPVNGPQSSGPSCYGFGPTGAPAHSPFSRALRALTTLSADHPGVRLVPSVKLPERPLLQTPPSPVCLPPVHPPRHSFSAEESSLFLKKPALVSSCYTL